MKILPLSALLLVPFLSCRVASPQPIEEPLSVKIKTNKTSYLINEPILLTYVLRNPRANYGYLLNADPFSFVPHLVEIKGPDGKIITTLEREGDRFIDAPATTLNLFGTSFYGLDADLQKEYPTPYGFDTAHSFDAPGQYEITGVYENQREYVDEKNKNWQRLWQGRVISKPIVIQVRQPSAAEIQQIQQAIRGGSETEKIRAVELVRKAKLKNLLDSIAPFLTVDVSANLKRAVAQTFFELPDVKYSVLYLKNLKSSNVDVRGYMALILGDELKLVSAVPDLIEVADPEKYPYSYKSVLRALIQIGDTRAIPAIRKIAETETSDVIKKYAQDNLKVLEAKKAEEPVP